MDRIMKWIKNQKLYKKIMYLMLGACLLELLVFVSAGKIICKSYNELMYEKTVQLFASYSGQVEMLIKELNVLTLSIIGDNSIQENLMIVRDSSVRGEEWRSSVEIVKNQLMVHFYNTDVIVDYVLYANGKFFNIGEKLQLDDPEEFVQVANDAKGAMLIRVEDDQIYLIRQIRQIDNYEFTDLGTLIAKIDVQKIIKDCNRIYEKVGVEMNVSVFVEDSFVYYDNEKVMPLLKDGWKIVEDKFIVQCSSNRGWKFLFYTSYGEVLSSIRIMILHIAAFCIIIVVSILLICRYFLLKIFGQLDDLIFKFDAYSEGILPTAEDIQEYQGRKDEIGYINRHFVEMTYKHKALEEEIYQKVLAQKEAEYKQLQHQIRPHFIFNTLSQIMWMAYQHNEKEIAELTKALSQLIRRSIAFDEKTITARQELSLVESYMYIQLVRYEKRVSFCMNVPEDMMDVFMPQMTIQPIVENAITYALEDMLDLCLITISGRVEGEKAIFIVEDNGAGIDPDILQKLVNGKVRARGNGIGLLNVQQRIQLAFSEEYGLSFYRIDGRTQVWITVPYVSNKAIAEAKKEGDRP